MKITKTPYEVISKNLKKEKANYGCYECPYCFAHGLDITVTYKTWIKGLIRMKNMRVDCYYCNKCGSEWESDEYEWI